MRHKIRKQEVEEINVGEKDKEGKWRGPAKEGKTVVVKQGSDVREIKRSHVIKMRKKGDYFENEEKRGEDED